MPGKHRTLGNHRGLAATVVAGALALSGATSVGVAVAHPQRQPQVQLAAPSSAGLPAQQAAPSRPPVAASAAPHVIGPVLAASVPQSLAIPAIGVRSPLLRLGQTAKGAMVTPAPGRDYDKAGWYRYSPTPGSLGPAVIAGHVDSARNGPSVFYRLGSLRPHDTVLVTRADGLVAVFAVDEVRRYHKTAFPTRLVYGNTDHAALRLITCGGAFDRSSGNYVDNIVVFASLVRGIGVRRPTVRPPAR